MPLNNIFSTAMRRANTPTRTTPPSWKNLFGGTTATAPAIPPFNPTAPTVPTAPGSGPMLPNYSGTQYGGSLVSGTRQPTAPIYGGPTPTAQITAPNVGVTNPLIPSGNIGVAPPQDPNRFDLMLNRAPIGVAQPPAPTMDVAQPAGPTVTQLPQDTIDVAPPMNPVRTEPPPIDVAENPNNQLQVTSETTTPYASSLIRQPWLTEGQQLAEDFNTEALRTGKFGAVESAKGAAERNSSLRRSLALQRANDTAMRAGYQPGTAQYQAVFDRALAEANMANLDERNSALGLQRSYIQDALGRAGEFEKGQYGMATGEREYGDARSDIMYNRARIERLENKADVERFLATVENPVARQFLENAWLRSGGDVTKFRAESGNIFDANGQLNAEYRRMSATIPYEDIRNKYTAITSGATNPDTGKAWTDPAEKTAFVEKHTAEDYAAMIQGQYNPVTREAETRSAIDEMTAVFTKGTKTDAEYKTALAGASNDQWKSMATNNSAQYDLALKWAKDNGVVTATNVPSGDVMNTSGELTAWLDSVGITGYDTTYNPEGIKGATGTNIEWPAGKGPLIEMGGVLYRMDYARNYIYNDNDLPGQDFDAWRRTQVVGTNVLTGETKVFQDENHDIKG